MATILQSKHQKIYSHISHSQIKKNRRIIKSLKTEKDNPKMSKLPNGLTIRQTKFCQNYTLPPHNATQSAISAGYSPHIAKTIGHRLKTNPKIQEYLKSLQSDLESRMTISYEWKLNKLKEIVEAFIENKENLISSKVNSAIQAISEMNKMQGHYSAERHVNFNIKADPDLQQLEDLIKKHGKEY